jgi:hypothetical protein
LHEASQEKEKTMKVLMKWLLLGSLLTAFVLASSVVAMAQGPTPAPTAAPTTGQAPVTLTVYDPSGAFEVTQSFAPRLADLNGKTICEVSDNSWETDRTFPLIASLLQKQFPTVKIIDYTKFDPATVDLAALAKLGSGIKAAGCQAAIVGNAG